MSFVSANHRRPLAAFVVLAMLGFAMITYQIRAQGVSSVLPPGGDAPLAVADRVVVAAELLERNSTTARERLTTVAPQADDPVPAAGSPQEPQEPEEAAPAAVTSTTASPATSPQSRSAEGQAATAKKSPAVSREDVEVSDQAAQGKQLQVGEALTTRQVRQARQVTSRAGTRDVELPSDTAAEANPGGRVAGDAHPTLGAAVVELEQAWEVNLAASRELEWAPLAKRGEVWKAWAAQRAGLWRLPQAQREAWKAQRAERWKELEACRVAGEDDCYLLLVTPDQ